MLSQPLIQSFLVIVEGASVPVVCGCMIGVGRFEGINNRPSEDVETPLTTGV